MTKRLMWIGAGVMTTALTLALLWQFRLVVVYFLLSLALAAALRPLLKRPAGQLLVTRLGLILLYLTALGGLVFLLITGVGAVVRDVHELTQQVSAGVSWRQPAWLPDSSFQQALDTWLPSPDAIFGMAQVSLTKQWKEATGFWCIIRLAKPIVQPGENPWLLDEMI